MQPRAARHVRQLVLPGIGADGQKRLGAARVLVVGCGGLAATALPQLVAAGIGHLTLMDDDSVEASNLNRQVLFTAADIGARKATVCANAMKKLDEAVSIEVLLRRFTTLDHALLANHDVTLDCTDGFPNKYLLNDVACAQRRPLIHGGATAWSGQMMSIVPGTTACLRCLFPSQPARGDSPNCQSAGILGAVVSMVGAMQAMEAIKIVVGAPAASRLHTLDGWAGSWRSLHLPVDPACPSCGPDPRYDGRRDADYRPDEDEPDPCQ
jgi:molybdopterin/thiamine biosynthesis adenylyltransferase